MRALLSALFLLAPLCSATGIEANNDFEGCDKLLTALMVLPNPNPREWSKTVPPSEAIAARQMLISSPSKLVQSRLCTMTIRDDDKTRDACISFVSQYGLHAIADMTVHHVETICSHYAGKPLTGEVVESKPVPGDVLLGSLSSEMEALKLMDRLNSEGEDDSSDGVSVRVEADDDSQDDSEDDPKAEADDEDEDEDDDDDDDDEDEDKEESAAGQAALAELDDLADTADHEESAGKMWGNSHSGSGSGSGSSSSSSSSHKKTTTHKKTTRKTTTRKTTTRRKRSSRSHGKKKRSSKGKSTSSSLKGIESIISKSVGQLPLTHHLLKMRMMQETAGVSSLIHQLNVQHYMSDPSCVDKDDVACQTAGLMDGMNYLSQQTSMPMGGLFGMAGPPDGSM